MLPAATLACVAEITFWAVAAFGVVADVFVVDQADTRAVASLLAMVTISANKDRVHFMDL